LQKTFLREFFHALSDGFYGFLSSPLAFGGVVTTASVKLLRVANVFHWAKNSMKRSGGFAVNFVESHHD
jgi:hypothetical protein